MPNLSMGQQSCLCETGMEASIAIRMAIVSPEGSRDNTAQPTVIFSARLPPFRRMVRVTESARGSDVWAKSPKT